MKKAISVILLFGAILSGGCAEMRQTTQLMSIALVELFRLPIYCMQLPFQILQNLGPIINASVRTAANVAPLLLFIERRVEKDGMIADGSRTRPFEESVRTALRSDPVPLLDVLESEMNAPGPSRFVLVDARAVRGGKLRRFIGDFLARDGGAVRCVKVNARDIFTRSDRFVELCRRMGERGDTLFAITAFNGKLAALTGTPEGALPPNPRDRGFFHRWHELASGEKGHARCEG